MKKISVIIPTWNEEKRIENCLKRLRHQSPDSELIVSDGGSSDRTALLAFQLADKVIKWSSPNRGAQLHRGALEASGDLLLFLHADCELPEGWPIVLEKAWSEAPKMAATVFSIDYCQAEWKYRLIEKVQYWRCKFFQVAYGDHAFCVPRQVYESSGGFPPIPLMEDIAFCRRLRDFGKIQILKERVRLSPRRQMQKGPLMNALKNNMLVLMCRAGVSPEKLWRYYYDQVRVPRRGACLPAGRDAEMVGGRQTVNHGHA
ncbi:MAG: TIGR04283 family arsenosugar biosynthesis glycosyltransferase [Elusimicrobia bacterium]|nr:TIGR04283 family arsenosugar biosynthesis glycosyltransferase [Elusimicrobiota bacterium]